MKAKSLLCLVLALVLVVSLAACGGDKKKKKDDTSSQTSSLPAVVSQAPTPEPMAKAVRVTADVGLNVRESPSTDGEIIGLAEENSRLPLLRETQVDGWYQVEFEGETAYVSAEFATMIEITQSEYEALRNGGAGKAPTATATPAASPSATPESGDDNQTSSTEPDESSSAPSLSNQDGE